MWEMVGLAPSPNYRNMLRPKVWNFSPPRSSISFKKLSLAKDISALVKNQFFTHHISITLPNAVTLPQEVRDAVMKDSQYYRVNNVPLWELVTQNFIDLFVKNGKLNALSIPSQSESDNKVAYIPGGSLVLILCKEKAQEIGLEGKNPSGASSSIFTLHVSSESVNKCKEIKTKFTKLDLYFDLILTWEPNDARICPSSIASYFSLKQYSVKSCYIKTHQRVSYNLSVPIYNEQIDELSLIEWLAAVNLQCNFKSDKYISTFSYSDAAEPLHQTCTEHYTGFISSARVQHIISVMQGIANKMSSCVWVGMVIQGFENGLIRGKTSIQLVGDHHHVLLFKPDMPALVGFYLEP